jgi:hypothetical protein
MSGISRTYFRGNVGKFIEQSEIIYFPTGGVRSTTNALEVLQKNYFFAISFAHLEKML